MRELQQPRIEYRMCERAAIVRFLPGPRGYTGRPLRDELVLLVDLEDPRELIVQFDSLLRYPAEILGCLTHAKKQMCPDGQIKCVEMPLQLKMACRLLRFDQGVLELYDRLAEATSHLPQHDAHAVAPADAERFQLVEGGVGSASEIAVL